MTLEPYGRFWAVRDKTGELVCLTVYKKGAREVVRRLSDKEDMNRSRKARRAERRRTDE